MKEIKKEITINSSKNNILEIGTIIRDSSKTSYYIGYLTIDHEGNQVYQM